MAVQGAGAPNLAVVGLQIAKQSQVANAKVVADALDTAREIAESAPSGGGGGLGQTVDTKA